MKVGYLPKFEYMNKKKPKRKTTPAEERRAVALRKIEKLKYEKELKQLEEDYE